jgi:predicted alpha/beta-hydrolase family hydrolase
MPLIKTIQPVGQTHIAECSGAQLAVDLARPDGQPHGIVTFIHDGDRDRRDTGLRETARVLLSRGFVACLMDLLTAEERRRDLVTHEHRFNLSLHADRVLGVLAWLRVQRGLEECPIGLFGRGTGAAVAAVAACRQPERIASLICEGGRVDLAGPCLLQVRAPTLLIVGARDYVGVELCWETAARMQAPAEIEAISGADHEIGGLKARGQVANLATQWMLRHFHPWSGPGPSPAPDA